MRRRSTLSVLLFVVVLFAVGVVAAGSSSWFPRARINAADVAPPLLERHREMVLAVALFLLGAAVGAGLVWQGHIASLNRERADVAETLREARENLDITLRSIGDAVIATDAAGNVVRMNPVAESLTGWNLEEAVGRPLSEVFRIMNTQTRQALVDPVAEVLASGQIVELGKHAALTARDGTERQIADSAAPIRSLAGLTVGVVLVFRDVTDEYASAEKLRLLERAIDASAEGICITGATETGNRLVYANQGFERLTGYPAGEVLGMNMRFLQGVDTNREAVDRLREAIQSNQNYSTELLNYRRDGTPFWNQISLTPVSDAADRISHFVAVLHDLTERKRVEQISRDSELRYRRLFEAAKDGILIIDTATGMVLDVNPCLIEMLGSSHDHLLGRKFWEIGSFQEVVADEANFKRLWRQEYNRYEDVPLRTAGGERRDVEFVSNTYRVDHRKVIQCNIRDITERKQTQATLRNLLREKESLLKEVHHRVKNNLQVISSLLRLQSTQVENAIARAALRDMQNRIESMALLHETLYQSRDFACVDLAEYLEAICSKLFQSLVIDSDRIQLHLDVASISLDMHQAVPCGLLINELLSNCLKHAFPDGRVGIVRVEVEPRRGGPDHCLRVADNGIGLPPGFEIRQSRSLGLHLVADLVSQIQGRLEIGTGPGALFEVVFTPQTRTPQGGAP